MAAPTKEDRPGARPVEASEPAPTVVSAEARAGEVIGDYVVDEVIGGGTFGVVVRATHRQLGRQVAIKILKRAYAGDDQAMGRFVAEARAVNRIRHPHIVDIYGFGTLTDGRHYYVMDLLRGQSLAEVLGEDARLPYDDALALLEPLADALSAAHEHGITHRDLKPENVFVVEGPRGREPRLLDFGVARIPQTIAPDAPGTSVGMVLGTPCYMAPEQALAEPIDARTDVFAFGVLTYRMLTGRLPWDGRSLSELVKRQLHGPHPTAPSKLEPKLPPHVDAAIEWMLRAEPSRRCPDVRTAIAALEGRQTAPMSPPEASTVNLRSPVARRAPDTKLDQGAAFDPTAVPSLTRIADEEDLAERSGTRRLAIVLIAALALGAGGYFALTRAESPRAQTVAFTFQGQPREAQILSSTGAPLGRIPGTIELRTRDLPTAVEIRAPGHRAQRRELTATSAKIQLVTLVPE